VPERPFEGFGNNFLVQYEEQGQILGYVRYRMHSEDLNGVPNGKVRVSELISLTEDAYAALWEYVFGIDLIGEVIAPWRQVDEPLAWMLADPRQLYRRLQDTLWVRLVDLPAALSGRRYLNDGQLVIEVEDSFCPWNAGRWLLDGGPGGATCSRTDKTPHVSMAADALGAVFLGGVRFETLQRAGRVTGDAPAIRLADRMFQWDRAPWEMEIF
jgi:predicted acetyltransferase